MLAALVGHGLDTAPLPPQMHAPDGFLTIPVAGAMWLVTIVVLAVSVRKTNETLDERAIPLMGVTAAFIFAAQMFNFQVVGGTSGHLLGGVLAAVLLGPWAATLVMACVIAVQALVFQDGGLRRDGRQHLQHGRRRHARRLLPVPHAGPAHGRRGQGAHPGRRDRRMGVGGRGVAVHGPRARASAARPRSRSRCPAMVGLHVFIGVGEALITMGALAFIAATRADLFKLRDARLVSRAPVDGVGGRRHADDPIEAPTRPAVSEDEAAGRRRPRARAPRALVVGRRPRDRRAGRRRPRAAGVVRPGRPRARRRGQRVHRRRPRTRPVLVIPDYTVPGIDGSLSTIVAGLIGIAIVFA